MSIKGLATMTAGGIAATIAAITVGPANADSATCIDAWNNASNAAAQQDLIALFADGGFGNVIVGSDAGGCVLAANNTNKPTYVVYRQEGDAYSRAGGGPGDQYSQYRATIEYLDVVMQASGAVEPVSQ